MSIFPQIRAGEAAPCRPWPRFSLSSAAWADIAARLADHEAPELVALWADTKQVHALFRDAGDTLIASVAVEAGCYPALSRTCPDASRFERLINDLWGHTATNSIDERTWLDHGRWPMAHPLSPRPALPGGAVEPPQFPAPPEEPGVMQVPLGPVHGLIAEPAHLRITACGDRVLYAESRLGYAHKGILALMRGKSPRAAARFIARLAAEATVAHSVAFALAAEAALDTPAPPRAIALREAMLEHEAAAGHLDDLARLADAAGLAPLNAAFVTYREQLLRAAEHAFGHRLMMDVVVPGGVAADIAPDGLTMLRHAWAEVARALPVLQRRLDPLLGRLDDLGATPAAAPQRPGMHATGDAAARCQDRMAAIGDRLHRLLAGLHTLPDGPLSLALPAESGEGLESAPSLRGPIWHWLRLDHGQIAAGFPCDPGWSLWPQAEAALAEASVEDQELIRLSFGLPCAALDL